MAHKFKIVETQNLLNSAKKMSKSFLLNIVLKLFTFSIKPPPKSFLGVFEIQFFVLSRGVGILR